MKHALAAVALCSMFAAGPAYAQRIVEGPLVAGFGHARCALVLQHQDDPAVRGQLGQWALGYYSGLLALDVEAAVPQWRGLDTWLRRFTDGTDAVTPVAARIVAQCQSNSSLSVEVAAQLVAMSLAAETRS